MNPESRITCVLFCRRDQKESRATGGREAEEEDK